MSYIITTATYGAGRGGEFIIQASTDQATSYVNINTIQKYYDQGGVPGLSYYLLHELTHTTPEGLSYNTSQFHAYLSRVPSDAAGANYYDSPEGKQAERFANAIALEMGSYTETPLWPGAPYGYVFP